MIKSLKSFFRKLKRFISFIPHVWRGYDWDYRYAIDLFTYQLSRTADFLESDRAWSIEAKTNAARMRSTIELMNKVYDEDYGMAYLDEIKEKYGSSSFSFKETKELDSKGDPYYTMHEEFEKDYTDTELLLIAEDREAMVHECRHKQRRAHKIAWDMIEHNIQKWWD